jgi:AraC-like DNA-binding protein
MGNNNNEIKLSGISQYNANAWSRTMIDGMFREITTEKSVSDIACDTAFLLPSYFTKCFKECFNKSPADYVKRIKQ